MAKAARCTFGCNFGTCLSSGECVCSPGYFQSTEFDLLNPAKPPDPRFSPCDVKGDAVRVLWGVAAASGALALVVQLRLWCVWSKTGNAPQMLPLFVRSALCAVGGGYRVVLGTALLLFDPFFSFVLVNWVVASVTCMVAYLISRLEAFAQVHVELSDAETPLGSGCQRKIIKRTVAAFCLFLNGSVMVAFLRPESERALFLRWILVSIEPFICLIGYALFHALSQLEKELRKFTTIVGLVSAVSTRGREANVVVPAADPARAGMSRQDTSTRAEGQLAYIAYAKRMLALAVAATASTNLLYAISDRVFYLAKYLNPLMLVIVELAFAAQAARQLPVQNARLEEQTWRATKRNAPRKLVFAAEAAAVAPQAAVTPAQAPARSLLTTSR
jgi:hypothetical protein